MPRAWLALIKQLDLAILCSAECASIGRKNEEGLITFTTTESDYITPNEERGEWELQRTGEFLFHDGTPNPLPSLPSITVDMNYIGDLRIMGYIFVGILVSSSLLCIGWTYVNQSSRVVRVSQPPFLIMICVGTIIVSSVIIPLGIDDQHFLEDAADTA